MTLFTLLKQKAKTSILLASLVFPFSATAHKTIGITQIVDHPSLNAIREGIVEELATQGFKEGEGFTILFESAQGNPTTAIQIAQKFASLSLDAVVPISTPSAQAVVHQIKTSPIVFAAITDPIEAKIVSSLNHPGGNVTGVSDMPPLLEQLNMITTCVPHLKVLGVVYNPGEANSVAMLDSLTRLAKEKNIEIKPSAAPNPQTFPWQRAIL
jgi:putative ABC transport system substrate-binding protein